MPRFLLGSFPVLAQLLGFILASLLFQRGLGFRLGDGNPVFPERRELVGKVDLWRTDKPHHIRNGQLLFGLLNTTKIIAAIVGVG